MPRSRKAWAALAALALSALALPGCTTDVAIFNQAEEGRPKLPQAIGKLPSLGIQNFSLSGAQVQGTTTIASIAILPNALRLPEKEDLEWRLADVLAGYARASQRFSRVLRNPAPSQRCDVVVSCKVVRLRLSKDPLLNALAILQPFFLFLPAQALTGAVELEAEISAPGSPTPKRIVLKESATRHLWFVTHKFGPTNFVYPLNDALLGASEQILTEALHASEGRR
jgi:hypothetical protein